MKTIQRNKITSLVQLFDRLPADERIMVDVLRQIVAGNLSGNCKEKIAFSVPYFYGKKGIAIIWPAAIPRGGIKKGVLLGFWQGDKMKDEDGYLEHGSNKKIFYKIYKMVEEIEQDEPAIVKLLKEAARIDKLK